MNKTTIIIIIIIIIIVLAGGYFLLRGNFNSSNYSPTATPSISSSASPSQTPEISPVSSSPAASASSNATPSASAKPSPSPANKTSAITIKNFAFDPGQLNIKVGDGVMWTNEDSVAHQIKSDTFNSALLQTGDSFFFRFNQPGTFNYFCAIHPSMTGKIIVQ